MYSPQAARRQALGGESRSSLEMEWAARILRENFLFMHLVLSLTLPLIYPEAQVYAYTYA